MHASYAGSTASFSPAVAAARQRKEPPRVRSLLLASLTFAALNWAVVLEYPDFHWLNWKLRSFRLLTKVMLMHSLRSMAAMGG